MTSHVQTRKGGGGRGGIGGAAGWGTWEDNKPFLISFICIITFACLMGALGADLSKRKKARAEVLPTTNTNMKHECTNITSRKKGSPTPAATHIRPPPKAVHYDGRRKWSPLFKSASAAENPVVINRS